MRRIRAIVIGVGKSAVRIHRLMVEKGIEIVGAIDVDPNKVGRDLGEVIDLDRSLNVIISDDTDKVLSENEADIAFACTLSTMEKMYPTYVNCVKNGLNVISMANTEIYPWKVYPKLTSKLDLLAKEYNVTVTGGGNQDNLFVHLPIMLSGCCSAIESIAGRATNDLNPLGAEVCRDLHVGKTPDQFREHQEGVNESQLYFRTWLESIAAKLDLTVKKIEYRDEPVVYDENIECKPLGKTIKKGLITGMSMITEMETDEGIELKGEYIGKIYKKGEAGLRDWTIKGEPDLYIDYSAPGVPASTRGNQLVNRIPDVINMEPGFISTEQYPALKYRHLPLHCYIK